MSHSLDPSTGASHFCKDSSFVFLFEDGSLKIKIWVLDTSLGFEVVSVLVVLREADLGNIFMPVFSFVSICVEKPLCLSQYFQIWSNSIGPS